jgi:hypothetical protein
MVASVMVQADGKILVAGCKPAATTTLVRYNADGSLDTSFALANTLDGAPTYTEDGPAVVLDSNVQVFDAELAAADNYGGRP